VTEYNVHILWLSVSGYELFERPSYSGSCLANDQQIRVSFSPVQLVMLFVLPASKVAQSLNRPSKNPINCRMRYVMLL